MKLKAPPGLCGNSTRISSMYFLPIDSQHRRLKIGTIVGHLKVVSRPFHMQHEPKRVFYKFYCECGNKCVKCISEVNYVAKSYPPHCGCRAREHLSRSQTNLTPRCNVCGTTELSRFRPKRKNICYECRKLKKRLESRERQSSPARRRQHNDSIKQHRESTPENFLRSALARLRKPCDFGIEYLMQLWERQNGRCKATGIKMTHCFRHLLSVSIDRIDNNMGYNKGNIRLVCKWVNLGRRRHTAREFRETLKQFRNGGGREYNTNDTKIRTYFRHLFRVIRQRIHSKIFKRRKGFNHNLTLYFLCDLYKSQKGRCAITKVPMRLQGGHLNSCSIDRIENSTGYLKDNIQLVCVWVNLARSYHALIEFKRMLRAHQSKCPGYP